MRITIDEALALFLHDEVVAIPTETVYGLAAPITSSKAIEKVFSLKRRPSSNPLILHVKNAAECAKYTASLLPHFEALTECFWPGPLTLIVPVKTELVPSIARAGLSTCGFRMPLHALTQELLERCPPLVAPSANLSGRPSGTKPEHIEADFGISFPILDGGISVLGLESTILAFQEGRWRLARQGALSQEALHSVLGYTPTYLQVNEKPICPGQLFRHYAPNTRLLLSENAIGDYIVGFSDRSYPEAKKVFSLGSSSSAEQVAKNLYDTLRKLDLETIAEASVDMNIPSDGLWSTIRERLIRAANQ